MSALQGIRVLDFGRFVAGPYCATMLAEFGAEVIRIEAPGGSEDRWLAPVMPTGEGSLFMQVGRNKRSLTLDLTSERGRALAHQLVQRSDIVIANMPRSTLSALGLDYETLKTVKPDIILVNATAYGDSGPWADRPGFDSVGQAMCGAVNLSGEPDRPYRAQVNWVDYATAVYSAFGALVALQERHRTGLGQQVTTSLLATALSFQDPILIDEAMLKSNRRGLGNRGYASGPTDLFRVRDGWIVCHVVSNPIFRRWARVIGAPELIDDPRLANDKLRGDHAALLSEKMSIWCQSRSRHEALEELAAAKIPAAPVLSAPEVLDHPQVRALGLLMPLLYRGTQMPPSVARVPVELSETPGTIHSMPPLPGQHAQEILGELGLSAEDVASLRAAGIV